MPEDPVILLSFVNTQLRDNYDSLESLCAAYDADAEALKQKLAAIDYVYDPGQNQFI